MPAITDVSQKSKRRTSSEPLHRRYREDPTWFEDGMTNCMSHRQTMRIVLVPILATSRKKDKEVQLCPVMERRVTREGQQARRGRRQQLLLRWAGAQRLRAPTNAIA